MSKRPKQNSNPHRSDPEIHVLSTTTNCSQDQKRVGRKVPHRFQGLIHRRWGAIKINWSSLAECVFDTETTVVDKIVIEDECEWCMHCGSSEKGNRFWETPTRQVSLQQGPAAQRPADLLSSAFFTSANGASNFSSLVPLFLRVSLMETLGKRTPTESTYTMLSYLTCFSAALLLPDRSRPRAPLPAPIAMRLASFSFSDRVPPIHLTR